MDDAEKLAIDRAKALFDCGYANVQPHSGAQANGAVYLALDEAGRRPDGAVPSVPAAILTHGAAPSQSGKWLKAVQYGVRKRGRIA